ncbi:MAG: short-chain dehydrogenase/reductase, partial [Acinetobacter sp.]
INLLEADAKVSAYDHIREKLHQQMIKSIQQSDEPRVVANTILTVINSRNILPRYTAGKTAKHLKNLRKFAPVKIFDKLIQRSLKI